MGCFRYFICIFLLNPVVGLCADLECLVSQGTGRSTILSYKSDKSLEEYGSRTTDDEDEVREKHGPQMLFIDEKEGYLLGVGHSDAPTCKKMAKSYEGCEYLDVFNDEECIDLLAYFVTNESSCCIPDVNKTSQTTVRRRLMCMIEDSRSIFFSFYFFGCEDFDKRKISLSFADLIKDPSSSQYLYLSWDLESGEDRMMFHTDMSGYLLRSHFYTAYHKIAQCENNFMAQLLILLYAHMSHKRKFGDQPFKKGADCSQEVKRVYYISDVMQSFLPQELRVFYINMFKD